MKAATPFGVFPLRAAAPTIFRSGVPTTFSPGGTMLEWKFRLVILMAVAGMIAAAVGNLGWHPLNLGW